MKREFRELHPDEREHLLDALHRRAARLAQVTEPGHAGRKIPAIVGMMAEHVLRTALALVADDMRAHWMHWLTDAFRRDSGLCLACGAERDTALTMFCQSCNAAFEEEDRAIGRMAAVDEPPKGRIS